MRRGDTKQHPQELVVKPCDCSTRWLCREDTRFTVARITANTTERSANRACTNTPLPTPLSDATSQHQQLLACPTWPMNGVFSSLQSCEVV